MVKSGYLKKRWYGKNVKILSLWLIFHHSECEKSKSIRHSQLSTLKVKYSIENGFDNISPDFTGF